MIIKLSCLYLDDEPDGPRDVGADDEDGAEDDGVAAGVRGGLGGHGALDVGPVDGGRQGPDEGAPVERHEHGSGHAQGGSGHLGPAGAAGDGLHLQQRRQEEGRLLHFSLFFSTSPLSLPLSLHRLLSIHAPSTGSGSGICFLLRRPALPPPATFRPSVNSSSATPPPPARSGGSHLHRTANRRILRPLPPTAGVVHHLLHPLAPPPFPTLVD
uniref:Uncharacterized protein n=1 Tax=Oryza nivara TaxID=4536 RepID=A0A0E0FKH8_ORYNI